MLKLSTPRGAWQIVLAPGAVLHLRGVEPADMVLARDAAAGFAVATPDAERTGIFWAVFTQVLLSRVLTGWEGIGDADGNEIQPGPDTIAQLLSIPAAFKKVDDALVQPLQLRVQEKNASSPLPNGTSPGASQEVPAPAVDSPIAGNA